MDIVVCGNPTVDELVEGRRVRLFPGGSALYASVATAVLGAKVGILGNVGDDYPEKVLKWLNHYGVSLNFLKRVQGPSTRFRISYEDSSRSLWLLQPGRTLNGIWTGPRVKGVHLGPVFNEIPQSLIRSARQRCQFLSLDIQGLIRRATSSGRVKIIQKDLQKALKLCDIVKASESEIKTETSITNLSTAVDRLLASGPKHVIVTRGIIGSILGVRSGVKYLIPAFPEPDIVDPTGAGDVFVGSWLRTFLWTRDPVWASSVGSAFASLTSRRRGLSKFTLSRAELTRRAAWVYGRVRVFGG